MPYITKGDPWNPYIYTTKQGKPRLPPPYFTRGYNFYQNQMNAWTKQLERENEDYWKRQSKLAAKRIWRNVNSLGEHRIPVYYNYTDWKKKAEKYAKIRRRIYLNKKKALEKRRYLLKNGLNKLRI